MKIMHLSLETQLEIEPPLKTMEPYLTQNEVTTLSKINTDGAGVDALLSSVKTLQGIHSTLQSDCIEGTINPYAAGALNAAVEHLCLQAKVTPNIPFHLEQLQGKVAKRKAVTYAMESISETIDNFLRKIIAWIKKIYDIVYDDIEYAIRGADAIARQARIIQEQAIKKQSIGGSSTSKKLINKTKLISYFNEDGKAMNASEIKENYHKYSTEMNESFSSTVLHNVLANIINTMHQTIKKIGTGAITTTDALKTSNAGVIYLKEHSFIHFKPTDPVNDNEAISYSLPFGNASILAVLGKEDNYYNFVSISLNQKIHTEGKGLTSLTPKEVIEFTKLIEEQMHSGIYRDHLKIKKEIKEIGKVVSTMCDEIIVTQSENGNSAIPSLHFLKSITSSLMTLTKILYSYNGVMNRSMLAYCETSLSNWN